MKVALVQSSCRLGDIKANAAFHLETIAEARRKKVDLVVFPELSLTGYTLRDLAEDVAIDPRSDPLFRRIAARCRGVSAVFGFMEERADRRGIFYNSAAFIHDGGIVHIHRKVFLPTNGMFDEARFYAAGREFRPFAAPFGRVGLLICRDFLHLGAHYALSSGGAEVIICISAAPGRGVAGDQAFETGRMWELMGEAVSYFSTAFVVYVNRVGVEDGATFAGGSFIYGPGGRLLAQAVPLDPETLVRTIDLSAVREARRKWVFMRDEKPDVVLRSLERIVRAAED